MLAKLAKATILLIFMQGYLMGAKLLHIDIKGVKIPIIFEQEKRLPIASLELVFQNSGSLSDSIDGIASFSAELLNEGTKKDGAIAFAKALEDRAVSLSANTGRETLVISLESLKSEFNFALKKLKELLADPNYTQKAFNTVKAQRLGEIEQKRSDFDYIASKNLMATLFKGTPLAHPSLGTKESIESLKLNQVEQFLKSHLILDNLIVVAGGNFTEDEIKEALLKAIDGLKRGEVKEIKHSKASNKQEEVVDYEDTKQAYIYFGSPYFMEVNDTNRVIGKVALFILGSGGFGSRLMEEIRVKRGLAYSAYGRSRVSRTYSYFSGYLQTKLKSAKEAKEVVKDVIDEFLKDGATKEELNSAKEFILGSEPLRNETLAQRMNRAFHNYYDGLGLNWSRQELEIIKGITLDELNSFIKEHQELKELSWSIVTAKKK